MIQWRKQQNLIKEHDVTSSEPVPFITSQVLLEEVNI